MTSSFSRIIVKERLDYYLDEIRKYCIHRIDDGEEAPFFELIRHSLDDLEGQEAHRKRSRFKELEELKAGLKRGGPPGI